MAAIVTLASGLQVGDIVERGNYAMRVEYVEPVTGRMVRWSGRYTSCSFDPDRIGQPWSMSTRVGTMLTVRRG